MAINTKLTIKELAEEDRPREKLILRGVNALSDNELIAILLGSGHKEESVLEVASNLLKLANYNLNNLARLSIKELSTIKGIGNARAINVIAALELGRRQKLSEILEKKQIKTSNDAADYLKSVIGDLNHEEAMMLMLDNSNKIIAAKKIGQGGLTATVMDPRIIFKEALMSGATNIIIAHNHPSGNINPSSSDISITNKLKEASKFLDIGLLDHIIVTQTAYYSFADEGKI